MKKQEIRTDKAPLPGGPYSQGLKAGSRVYVAGQRPVDAATGAIPPEFQAQAKLVLDNVRHVLEAGGAAMDDVVKVTVYLSDIANFAAFNEVYVTYFTAPYPTRTTVSCALRGILVEVDAIAEIGE
ncbi:MAG: Putative reactive intermediate deaminase TdcF [Desulfovibrio sp.]